MPPDEHDHERDRDAGRAAAEAFASIGNEIRTEILLALVESDADRTPFSDLRDAVGVADSGQFNYHLEQLVGRFVDRTEEGYELRYAGRRIAYALLAGTYTDRPRIEPTPAPGTCYACGADALLGSYANERLTIECDACDERILRVSFPPAAVTSRQPEAAFRAFNHWAVRQGALLTDRICPECAGRLTATVSTESPPTFEFDYLPTFECTVCTRSFYTTFGSVAIQTRELLALLHRHGWERDDVYWSIDHCVTDDHTSVAAEDPLRIRETFPLEDATVSVTFDEAVEIVDVAVDADD